MTATTSDRDGDRGPELRVRFPVDDVVLSALHARAFGLAPEVTPWSRRLERTA